MKLFLLLLFISVTGLKTGFSQAAQKQASQVITLRLAPVDVIEIPVTYNLHTAARHNRRPRKWLINKQILAQVPGKSPSPAGAARQQKPPAGKANPIVYTITCL